MQKKRLYEWVKAQSLPRPEKAVLRQLAHFADAQTGEAWATISALADEVDYCERKVQYALRALERDGIIENTGRTHRNQQRRLIPIYRLALPQAFAAPPTGEGVAPHFPAPMRPSGRTCVHPHKKNPEIHLSNERAVRKGSVPPELRAHFAAYRDEGWTRAYIDPCIWHEASRALEPIRETAGDRILRDARWVLREQDVQVLGVNGHVRP